MAGKRTIRFGKLRPAVAAAVLMVSLCAGPSWAQDDIPATPDNPVEDVEADAADADDADGEEAEDAADAPAAEEPGESGMPEEDRSSPLRGNLGAPEGASPEFVEALQSYQTAFGRYANEINDYQTTVDEIVEAQYAARVAEINSRFESRIKASEAIEREYRKDAIASFELFLERFPNTPRYTPDALYRLADLQFEKANDDFLLADEAFQKQLTQYEAGEIADPPNDPIRDYGPTIATFERLINDWPDYRFLDGAYYLLAYCELQMGNEQRARDLFAELIVKRPESEFVPEAWIRIGEYHFDVNELDLAGQAYAEAMKYPESKFYDKALYKLAWTYYRKDDFDSAIKQFKVLVEYSDEQERKTGRSGSVLRAEAVQYIAISLAEEDWDLDGVKDDDFGLMRAKKYLDATQPYHREVLVQLADYLFENTRYDESVLVLRYTLSKYPLDRNNPEIHEQIILALIRNNDLDAAFEERGKLSSIYGPGSDWFAYQQKQGNVEATRYAQNLVKDNLIQSATWYHAEAQKQRQEAEVNEDSEALIAAQNKYRTAATAYADFLQQYPNDKDFYQWNFYYAECLYYSEQYVPAYEQYKVVREMDVTNNQFQEVAAFNAVKALEFELQEAVQSGRVPAKVLPGAGLDEAREAAEAQETAREGVDERSDQKVVVKAETLPALALNYVTAMDRYVVLDLKNEQDEYLDAKFAFQSAKMFYDFKDYPTARKRFEWIVNQYPENEVAYLAGSLILETYRQENDFTNLAAYAEKLSNVLEGEQVEAIREEVREFKLGALFKSAEQLFAAGKYEQAAEEYLRLLSEDPDTKFAAKALNNAAVAYENVQRYDSAMKLYQRVYKEHPKDPLASYALYRVAVNQERFFDFSDAVQSYELFYDKYDDSKQAELDEVGLTDFKMAEKRGDALRSAAVLKENLQRYPDAARGYERFANEYPESDQAPEAAWQAAIVWEKAGEKRKMIDAIETFISKYGADSKYDDRVMGGLMKIADYHEERGSKRAADKEYNRILETYQSRGIRPGTPGAANAAKSRFMLAEREFEEWDKIQIKGSLKRQEKLLTEKIEKQKALTASYEEVFAYGSFDWTLASNFRVGNLLQRFAFSLYEVPIPFAEGSEEADIYRTQLEDIAIPLEDAAIERYEKNISEARDKKVVNEWTKRTLEELNKYKPAEYPLFKEERRTFDEKTITGDPYISAEEWTKRSTKPAPKSEEEK